MKKAVLIALAALAASGSTTLSSAATPHRYDIQVRLLQGGKLISSPHLITAAGERARFVSDDGKRGWSLDVTATPNAARAAVAVATDAEFWSGAERRRASAVILVSEGEVAAIEVPPRGSNAVMRVEITLHSL